MLSKKFGAHAPSQMASMEIKMLAGSAIDRSASNKMLMQIFAHWQLSTKEMLDALGYLRSNRAILSKLQHGAPISLTRDTMNRTGHIFGIHKNLRLLFSHNRDLAYSWMKTRNRAFDNRTPIEVVHEYGFAGVLMVRAYLDRARGQ